MDVNGGSIAAADICVTVTAAGHAEEATASPEGKLHEPKNDKYKTTTSKFTRTLAGMFGRSRARPKDVRPSVIVQDLVSPDMHGHHFLEADRSLGYQKPRLWTACNTLDSMAANESRRPKPGFQRMLHDYVQMKGLLALFQSKSVDSAQAGRVGQPRPTEKELSAAIAFADQEADAVAPPAQTRWPKLGFFGLTGDSNSSNSSCREGSSSKQLSKRRQENNPPSKRASSSTAARPTTDTTNCDLPSNKATR
jgi:hypothetical protein